MSVKNLILIKIVRICLKVVKNLILIKIVRICLKVVKNLILIKIVKKKNIRNCFCNYSNLSNNSSRVGAPMNASELLIAIAGTA